jgi:hypothetical protein
LIKNNQRIRKCELKEKNKNCPFETPKGKSKGTIIIVEVPNSSGNDSKQLDQKRCSATAITGGQIQDKKVLFGFIAKQKNSVQASFD